MARTFDGKIGYSEATDVFQLMDHVTGFKLSLPIYAQVWAKKFPLTVQDRNLFSDYIKLRKRYYQQKEFKSFDQSKLLFSHIYVPQFDKFADAFYTSRSVGEALKKLKRTLKPNELTFLANFYKHYQPKISQFIKESTLFSQKLKSINKQLKKIKLAQTMKKMGQFLGVPKKLMNLQLLFVWWPAKVGPQVTYGHNVVLLHYNPISQTENIDMQTIAEMVMKAFIFRMPYNQKENLSKRFFSECRPRKIDSENILQTPLMVLAGKIMAHKASVKKKEFNLYQQWDDNPWVNLYAKTLYPALESALQRREMISVHFISQAAQMCREILVVEKYLD
jgi:hypothetical protein